MGSVERFCRSLEFKSASRNLSFFHFSLMRIKIAPLQIEESFVPDPHASRLNLARLKGIAPETARCPEAFRGPGKRG
jgi:hypothetical protein